MTTDVLVVGAGLAGSVAARHFAESGRRVLVVEQHRHVAGHCHDSQNDVGITVHTYGPHIFHTVHKSVWDFVNRFAPFRYYQHRVLSYAEGRFIPFPINRDTINEVFGVQIGTGDVEAFLAQEVAHADVATPPRNFRDAVVSQVGERLYNLFFRNYTMKQWGRDPAELSAEVAKRIPVRRNRDDRYFSDQYQGMPVRGYTQMVENMLDHPKIALLLGVNYFELKNELAADLTVYTGELDRFFEHRHGKLEYRSLDLEFQTLDQQQYQPAPVVNYPNDYDWTRITECKQLTGERSDKTTVCFEYPKAEGEPYYIVMTEENMRKREQYMQAVSELEQQGTHLFVGRLAEYKYYNMDQVILRVFERLEQGGYR